MMVHLPPHRRRLANHRVAKVGRLCRRGIHDHGERRFQRVGQIARMPPRFLRLALIMGEQFVQFLDHRHDLIGQRRGHAVLVARPHAGDFLPHRAKRPQPVKGLQGRHDDKADAQYGEALDQCRPERPDLLVQTCARLGDSEFPGDIGPGKPHGPFHDAQILAGKLPAVENLRTHIFLVEIDLQRPVPQRPGPEIVEALAADLEINAAPRLQEALVGERPDQPHFPVRPDLGRTDHRGQHIAQAIVKAPRDRLRQHPVQRHPAADQQQSDPQCRNADHPAAEGACGALGAGWRFGLQGWR